MSEPDYTEMAESISDSNGVVYLTKEYFAEALREAYDAGLERAAEIAEDRSCEICRHLNGEDMCDLLGQDAEKCLSGEAVQWLPLPAPSNVAQPECNACRYYEEMMLYRDQPHCGPCLHLDRSLTDNFERRATKRQWTPEEWKEIKP